jgi:hypothetical protein
MAEKNTIVFPPPPPHHFLSGGGICVVQTFVSYFPMGELLRTKFPSGEKRGEGGGSKASDLYGFSANQTYIFPCFTFIHFFIT